MNTSNQFRLRRFASAACEFLAGCGLAALMLSIAALLTWWASK
jgi:hypothetical protein